MLGSPPPASFDVVLVTSLSAEYRAVLDVEEGAAPGSAWAALPGPHGLPLVYRPFRGPGDRPLMVAAVQTDSGGVASAANVMSPILAQYRPSCVAMVGACSGRPGKTSPGDVIVAERLFLHDAGLQGKDGVVLQDVKTFVLRDDWKLAVEHFPFIDRFRMASWWNDRPIPLEWQENWLLGRLLAGDTDPASHSDCARLCRRFDRVIEALWSSQNVEDGTLTLTPAGRKRIGRILIPYGGRFPDLTPAGKALPFKIHVAPIASGNRTIADPAIWSTITRHVHAALGIDTGAAAVGAHAQLRLDGGVRAIVMKGVANLTDDREDEDMLAFAARAAAECMIAFARENVSPVNSSVQSLAGPPAVTAESPSPVTDRRPPVRILFLAAEPTEADRLNVGREVREVQAHLRESSAGREFDLIQAWAVRPKDLAALLLHHRPQIVHFSGHGSRKNREIVLEQDDGTGVKVPVGALGMLFGQFREHLRCVVLNACYSEPQACAIAEHIECVVGVTDHIRNPAALAFACKFYLALAYGKSVKQAFDLGVTEIALENIGETGMPSLLPRTGVDADKVFFAPPPG